MRTTVSYFKLSQETLHLAVDVLDRYLAIQPVKTSVLGLLAITCIHIASKKVKIASY